MMGTGSLCRENHSKNPDYEVQCNDNGEQSTSASGEENESHAFDLNNEPSESQNRSVESWEVGSRRGRSQKL
ncbi:hypothetical protein L2E82_32285 [Cichorium intybus]|uniref:Uncharacterized protein n=1 Tax=Cichorium intybus TaxID=13427 RepID=A0ACB9BFZ5_CICIN|nr:hypothetical protein L2E82_32285 [Cichorium intybus]